MTNPNHTDTSRSGELEKCFSLGDCAWTVRQAVRGYVARHRALIEALEALLTSIANAPDAACAREETAWEWRDAARAALGEKQ